MNYAAVKRLTVASANILEYHYRHGPLFASIVEKHPRALLDEIPHVCFSSRAYPIQ
jgi:hypothetical protein